MKLFIKYSTLGFVLCTVFNGEDLTFFILRPDDNRAEDKKSRTYPLREFLKSNVCLVINTTSLSNIVSGPCIVFKGENMTFSFLDQITKDGKIKRVKYIYVRFPKKSMQVQFTYLVP